MGEEGSLDLHIKLYLGIMAVSCFNCSYLLNILEEQFVLNGGEIEWITQGIKAVEPRVAKFAEINEILAYKPWALSSKHVEQLLKSDDLPGWSLQSILTACSVMSHYHALSSFVLGQGLTEDAEIVSEQMKKVESSSTNPSSDADSQAVSFLKLNKEDSSEEGDGEDEGHLQFHEELENKKSKLYHAHSASEADLIELIPARFKIHRLCRLSKYENFDVKANSIQNYDDFNWEEHVYSILFKFMPAFADCLNNEAIYGFQMTKNTFGQNEVDTAYFRLAIHNYLQYIFGLKDDACDYNKINKVLQYPHKVYIKRMMCEPHNLTADDFKDLTQLLPEERAHIGILVMETKKRVELLYLTKVMSLFL